MKRLALIFAALLLCAATHAQQALWSGSAVVSPDIHEDNSVTFRLVAPNATQVQITGDFLPTQKVETSYGMTDAPISVDLQKNGEGVWEYTSEPLAPELYSYLFTVDGLAIHDPSNVYMIRDVARVTNFFIIGGDRADLYKVNDVPHGTVARVWYDCPGLGMARRMTVYTPAGYEDSDKSYPVLYLLHGTGGDEEAWIALGRTSQILDNLIARGEAEPMIVVMTNGNSNEPAAPGEDFRGMIVPDMNNTIASSNGTFERSFPEIINFIESHYRAISDKHARAIAGLSMGGFHSLHISAYYPDLFDYVGLFSAAISFARGKENDIDVYSNVQEKVIAQFEKKPALYWIGIGAADGGVKTNAEYREFLDAHGFPYTYLETEGGHIWKNWRIYLSELAPKLFK